MVVLPAPPQTPSSFRASGDVETIPSKLMTVLRKGDRVIVTTAGGGGNGNPEKRSAVALSEDVGNGKVSAEAAAKHYGSATFGLLKGLSMPF